MTWASYQIRKIGVAHAPGMPGTFSPPLRVSDPDMHHGTCVTHVPWCMPGLLTSGFLWSQWRRKRSRHSRRMRNPQFYISGKRPMETFSASLTFVKKSSIDSPLNGSAMLYVDASFVVSWMSCWTNSRVVGDFRHHVAHVFVAHLVNRYGPSIKERLLRVGRAVCRVYAVRCGCRADCHIGHLYRRVCASFQGYNIHNNMDRGAEFMSGRTYG